MAMCERLEVVTPDDATPERPAKPPPASSPASISSPTPTASSTGGLCSPEREPATPLVPRGGREHLCGDRCTPSGCASFSLLDLPIQSAGIALNIVAIVGLLDHLLPWYPSASRLITSVQHVLVAESSVLQGLCIARGAILIKSRSRLLRLPAFWPELSSRRQTAGYGALLVAIQLTGGQFAARPWLWRPVAVAGTISPAGRK